MEVRSEQGLMVGRELFSMQKSPAAAAAAPAAAKQSVRMAYTPDGTPVFTPVSSAAATTPPQYQQGGAVASTTVPAAGAGGNGPAALPEAGEPAAKKKRGRPRKYGPDGSMSLALVSTSTAAASAATPGAPGPFSPTALKTANPVPSASPDGVKKRGRPKGSTNKQQMGALGSAGVAFTPHIITVKAGEDVSAKIMSFSQHGTRAVCVLSANGAISNVTLRQAATLGGTVTYEGRFEILSLSGSFLLTENGGQRSRTGGLSVSLAGPDGRVLGGGVAGLLTAASPVQIVVGSFNADGKKELKQQAPSDPACAPAKPTPARGMRPSSPLSRGTMSESSGGTGSPLNQGIATCNNQPALSSMPWK